MYTIEELTFDKIRIRKSNPVRAAALGRIVDVAQKAAKQEKRSTEVADISKAAEKLTKEALKDIKLFGEASPQADALRKEVEIYKEFLPEKLSSEDIIELVKAKATEIDLESPRARGMLVKELKSVEGMDMPVLLSAIDSVLLGAKLQ